MKVLSQLTSQQVNLQKTSWHHISLDQPYLLPAKENRMMFSNIFTLIKCLWKHQQMRSDGTLISLFSQGVKLAKTKLVISLYVRKELHGHVLQSPWTYSNFISKMYYMPLFKNVNKPLQTHCTTFLSSAFQLLATCSALFR